MDMISGNFIDKIYGGVLGKIAGVRLGILFENRDSSEIQREYPHITGYVMPPGSEMQIMHPDDDTNGFMLCIKIFERISSVNELTPEVAAHCLINLVAADRGFFWWQEGFAENGAFHNLINGVPPSECGDRSHIGAACDHVGGQIFYDAVGLIFAGRPEEAACCAGIISEVMHRGEGALGGRFMCACISAAFTETDLRKIIGTGLSVIPETSRYAGTVRDILRFYEREPQDWKACLRYIEENYHSYMIWDYTAVILLALLYGEGDFQRSMELCLHCGGDTDGNCGTLGAILGVLGGWQAIPYEQWIAPLHDTLYYSSALPGENEMPITRLTARIIRLYCKFARTVCPEYIEDAASPGNYAFALPYAFQDIQAHLYREDVWRPDLVSRERSLWITEGEAAPPGGSPYTLKFVSGQICVRDCIRICRWFSHDLSEFVSLKYEPTLCPCLYPGQTVRIRVRVPSDNGYVMNACLMTYDPAGQTELRSEYISLPPDRWQELSLMIPPGAVFYPCVNVEMIPWERAASTEEKDKVTAYFDDLRVEGVPDYTAEVCPPETYAHYPVIKDFAVCYNPERFPLAFPGRDRRWEAMVSCNHPKLMMLLTGPTQMCQYKVFCEFVLEEGDTFLVNLAVRGVLDHYAAGFYKNRLAIVRPAGIPGEYAELAAADAVPPARAAGEKAEGIVYTCEAEVHSRHIVLKGYARCGELILQEETVFQHTEDSLSGCIGFTSFEGNRIRILRYGVKPLE